MIFVVGYAIAAGLAASNAFVGNPAPSPFVQWMGLAVVCALAAQYHGERLP